MYPQFGGDTHTARDWSFTSHVSCFGVEKCSYTGLSKACWGGM